MSQSQRMPPSTLLARRREESSYILLLKRDNIRLLILISKNRTIMSVLKEIKLSTSQWLKFRGWWLNPPLKLHLGKVR